jgi:hypothetical protein
VPFARWRPEDAGPPAEVDRWRLRLWAQAIASEPMAMVRARGAAFGRLRPREKVVFRRWCRRRWPSRWGRLPTVG